MCKAKRVCVSVVVFGALLGGIPRARAQSEPQESVAEAARRAREQKKEAAKPATVITNDTLEPPKPETPAAAAAPAAAAQPAAQVTTDATPSTPAPSGASAAPSGGPSAAAPAAAPSPEDRAAKEANLSSLKQQIQDLQKEADLAQRVLNLANDDFYSKPDFSKDDEGKAKLDALKSDLAQKLEELAKLKAELTEGGGTLDEKPAHSEGQGQAPAPAGSQSQPESSNPPQQQ